MADAPHPRRGDYGSDVEYYAACMDHLDHLYPSRPIIRRVLWQSIEAEQNPEATVARIRELLILDRPFTDDEADEWDSLTTTYHEIRRASERAKR